jgi:hypothetical protein
VPIIERLSQIEKKGTFMGLESNPSPLGSAAHATPGSRLEEESDLSPETLADLQMVRQHRANLLVVGEPAATAVILDLLGLSARDTIMTWRPRQPLELPPPGRTTTLILHDVDQLSSAAQGAVLRWLDQCAGQTWVVSTTTEPLWRRVEAGAFSETLYYRLNIVCLSAASED